MSGVPSPDTAADAATVRDALYHPSLSPLGAALAALDRLVAALTAAEQDAKGLRTALMVAAGDADRAARERDELREALRAIVGESYNLLTQGESPTQRRQPSAQRIYDTAKAALAASEGEVSEPGKKSASEPSERLHMSPGSLTSPAEAAAPEGKRP